MTRPIKVIRVIARMNVGGPAWQVSVLTRGLQPPEFETHLVCGRVADDEADFIELRDPSLPCTYLEGLGRSVKPLDDLRFVLGRNQARQAQGRPDGSRVGPRDA